MGLTPALELNESGGRCRLSLAGLARGEGETLQEAADELIDRLRTIALRFRTSGLAAARGLGPPDVEQLAFVWELGEIAARGGDLRGRVFGFPDQ